LDFADEVLEATGGEGVDVVLNSLTGEAAFRSLLLLRPGGRFLELGKRDIEQAHRLPLGAFQNNVSYFAIDLDRLWVTHPQLMAGQLGEVMRLVEERALRPLPRKVFPITQAAEAFRHMARARHIGKVVLSVQVPGAVVEPSAEETLTFRPDGTYLLVGGLGGFGLATAAWLVERGARHLVLVGRRGAATPEAGGALEGLRGSGAEVVAAAADVSQPDEVVRVLEQVRASMPPLRGVVHCAMVLDDALISQLNEERLLRVLAPKVHGAWILHQLTQDDPLDFFILFSSAVATLGNPGQANYAAANAFLDALAHHRRAQGRVALAINWTAVADVGHLARHPEVGTQLARIGLEPLPSRDLLRVLGKLLHAGATQTAVMHVDWKRVAQFLPGGGTPRLHDLIGRASSPEGAAGLEGSPRQALLAAGPADQARLLEAWLREQLAKVLGVSPSKIEADQPLTGLGLDSLMAVELGMRLRKDLEIDLPVMKLLGGLTVVGLATDLARRLQPRPEGGKDASAEENGKADAAPGPSGRPMDWDAETILPAEFSPAPDRKPAAANPSRALLTGATGFLGSFLLDELLRQTELQVFCLVRARDDQEARERIRRSLESYLLWDERYEGRIVPVVGDLAAPDLGLSSETWGMLAESIDVIYHSGARLNLLESYAALRPANVHGTRALLRLACGGKFKPVHHVSTLGVFDLPPGPAPVEIDEGVVPSDIGLLRFGYTQSKAVAEHLVRAAATRGVPAAIYRPGLITACSTTGAYTTDDFLAQMLKSWVVTGLAPVIDQGLLFTPVEFVSRAIVSLSRQPASVAGTFHLMNPTPLHSEDLAAMIRAAGYPLEVESYYRWRDRLAERAREGDGDWSALLPLLGVGGESLPLWPPRNVRFRSERTDALLARDSILCPPIDARLMDRCLAYFRRVGFLPPPKRVRGGSGHLVGSAGGLRTE
jgi:thioester reductase-like protein